MKTSIEIPEFWIQTLALNKTNLISLHCSENKNLQVKFEEYVYPFLKNCLLLVKKELALLLILKIPTKKAVTLLNSIGVLKCAELILKKSNMKKAILIAALLVNVGAFAKCGSISLGFVTIITGTYQVQEFVGYDSNLNPIYQLVTKQCSEGNTWQWFWED